MVEHLESYSMRALCQALTVSRSGFYAWRKAQGRGTVLPGLVKSVYEAQKGRVGAPSVAAEVKAQGHICSVRTVGRIMKRQGLKARYTRKFRHTTDSRHRHDVAPNVLDRQFSVAQPNQVWVGDITYLQTSEGWLYLAVMIDLFSRQVVGWQMSQRIDKVLVNDALQAALVTRGNPSGVMIHTDRGSQYCAGSFKELIAQHQLTQSMSRKGNCWDNAVAESFFATLKKQAVYGYKLKTRDQMRQHVFEYIEIYYNRVRRHSANNWVSPVEYERLYDKNLERVAV